jgi:uroporphyrinogen-III synthase
MQVLVTRPAAQAGKWVQVLQQAGLQARALPLIDISPVLPASHDVFAVPALKRYGALMFVSANAVSHFFCQLSQRSPEARQLWSADASTAPRMYATGPGTAAALQQEGVAERWIDAPGPQAAKLDSEALWERVARQCVPGFRVLVVRGRTRGPGNAPEAGEGRDWFASQVVQAQGRVDFCVVYQRGAPALTPADLALAQAASSDGTVWLFSSSEAVANLQTLLPQQGWQAALAVATHARIVKAASDAGFGTVLESGPQLETLLASIESLA